MEPVLLVIAGPNGAGKTTITVRLRADHWSEGVVYLNPDDVARDRFGDWNSPAASLEAARWVTARREELLDAGSSLAFETVFSAPDKIAFIEQAKAQGYFVRVFFVSTSDPRINAGRVTGRVMQGGHTVPIDKIVSRYEKSHANLLHAVAIVDRVYIYDNSIDNVDAKLCARIHDGALRKIYGALPEWVADSLDGLPQHADFVDLRG